MNLLTNGKIYNTFSATTGAQVSTSLQSSVLDSAGFDGVMWICAFHSNANSSGGYSKLYHQHGSSSESTSMVSCTGSGDFAEQATTALGATNGKTYVLDVFRPSERYVSAYATLDSTNAVGVNITGILYNSGREPTEQSTGSIGVLASAVTVSPTT